MPHEYFLFFGTDLKTHPIFFCTELFVCSINFFARRMLDWGIIWYVPNKLTRFQRSPYAIGFHLRPCHMCYYMLYIIAIEKDVQDAAYLHVWRFRFTSWCPIWKWWLKMMTHKWRRHYRINSRRYLFTCPESTFKVLTSAVRIWSHCEVKRRHRDIVSIRRPNVFVSRRDIFSTFIGYCDNMPYARRYDVVHVS